jgi:hypothetical protein
VSVSVNQGGELNFPPSNADYFAAYNLLPVDGKIGIITWKHSECAKEFFECRASTSRHERLVTGVLS